MNRAVFVSLLRDRLYPVLHSEGFRGSGSTLRRIEGPSVQVFNVQAGSGGDRCHLNLGVHFDFLPAEGGQSPSLQRVSESQCAFRRRITPPADQALGWSYGRGEQEAQANVDRIVAQWPVQAHPFFREHAFPGGVAALIAVAAVEPMRPRDLLTRARIALRLGHRQRAVALAETALQAVQPVATGLRHEIKQFLAATSVA